MDHPSGIIKIHFLLIKICKLKGLSLTDEIFLYIFIFIYLHIIYRNSVLNKYSLLKMLLEIAHIDFICWVMRSLMLSGRCKASVIKKIPIWVYMDKMDSL